MPVSPHLSRVGPFHALQTHALWSGACVALLGHPLTVGSAERSHALGPGLVHAHGRAADVGRIHARAHVAGERRGSSGSRLVHELAVVGLVWSHLERGTHLENNTSPVSRHRVYYGLRNQPAFVIE